MSKRIILIIGVAAALAAVLVEPTGKVEVEWKGGFVDVASMDAPAAKGSMAVAAAVSQLAPEVLPTEESSQWYAFAQERLGGSVDFASMMKVAGELDSALKLSTFLGGNSLSLGDVACWSALRSIPAWNKTISTKAGSLGEEVARWFTFISAMETTTKAIATLQEQAAKLKEKKKDQASYDIDLFGAEYGKVVTRFPPEPSGYLHIGHAKAAMLNQYFAQAYGGRLIIRFDDTNPTKEKSEFEQSILEDLNMLGIKGDLLTYSSDHFERLEECCREMIRRDKAYADDTPKEQMNEERYHGIPSKSRNRPIEDSLRIFESMLKGSEETMTFCIRAKISFDNPNKAMRDPVIYRCNLTPHHRTGDKHKAYPTYDFACPIIDSIEGVTHALRTNEYHDRNDQYYWMVDALEMRKPFIWDYSRLNFVYTLLSKRNLRWFVEKGIVGGWDDPRFPTVRGILRRGLTTAALREYILMQGPSKNVLLLEWDKLWAVNKKHIDPVAPRYVALNKEGICKVVLKDGPAEAYTADVLRHKKNPELGNKQTAYSSTIFIEQEDARSLEQGEEITLMDWGNAIIEEVLRSESNNEVLQVVAKLHLEGDFKKTKKKLTWLSPEPNTLIPVAIHDYDYLITKKKLEEEDSLENFVTPVSEFVTAAVGDANMSHVKQGDIIQLERKGFFICDRPYLAAADGAQAQPLKLIAIPDGKSKSTSSKNETGAEAK